jgi:predicted ATPase/class 3 adenylate cyclase
MGSIFPSGSDRRHCTIVFCDLVGSTELSERLDPEDFREILRAYQTACAAVVEQRRGHIAQYLGDGILAYFGYPTAAEDDPSRAVSAALGLVDAVEELNQRRPWSAPVTIQIRVGVHTGLVVTGEVGGGEHREHLALGHAANLAARLQGLAAPGTVVVSRDTHKLVAGLFEFEALGQFSLKGAVSDAFRPTKPALARTRFDLAVASGLIPLQGRDRELSRLSRAVKLAIDGNGQALIISGEAGIGKSRLLREASQMWAAHGLPWISGRCSPDAQNTPFAPIADALAHLLKLAPLPHDSETSRDAPESVGARPVTTSMLKCWCEARALCSDAPALLAPLLGVELAVEVETRAAAQEERRERTIQLVAQLILAESRQRPLVLALEDLHWVDPSSLEVLRRIADGVGRSKCLLLGSLRRPSTFPQELASAEVLTLTPLSDEHIAGVAEQTAGARPLARAVIEAIVVRADGVPLYAEELTKNIIERSGGASNPDATLRELAIPTTLQDLLFARLDRLNPGKQVGQVASVFGREFRSDMLAALDVFSEEELRHGLGQLVASELVKPLRGGRDGSFVFKHALIHEAAYHSLLKTDRKTYHRAVVGVLLDRFPPVTAQKPELVAQHAGEAGLHEQAAEYWQKAAERAIHHAANAEALQHITHALAALAQLTADAHVWEKELGLRLLLGRAATAYHGYGSPEVEAAYTRALELCQQLGHTPADATSRKLLSARLRCGDDFFARSGATESLEQARLFWAIWGFGAFYQARGELTKALDAGERLIALAGEDPSLLLEGHFGSGSTLFFMGRFERSKQQLQAGWQCYLAMNSAAKVSPTGHHAEVLIAAYLALTLARLGALQEAEDSLALAMHTAQESAHSYSVAYALTMSSWLAQMKGEPARALTYAEQAVSMGNNLGFGLAVTWSMPVMSWAKTMLGSTEDPVSTWTAHMQAYRQSGYRIAATYFAALVAEQLMRSGRREEAISIARAGLTEAEETGERFYEPELRKLSESELPSRRASSLHQPTGVP